MTEPARLKIHADAENEIQDMVGFHDLGRCVVTPIATFPESIALGVVSVLSALVRDGHARPSNHQTDQDGIVRAQKFEEGDVLMTAAPFDGFTADRYVMDFYDVDERDICSRMHFHTGMRFVRIMTGPDTRLRISALSPMRVTEPAGLTMLLHSFEDESPRSRPGEPVRSRYNLVVPPCSWVDMQIPRGTAHQFNAMGPHAVIDTVHPEESIEIFREKVEKINMMKQTVFLEKEQPSADSCALDET